MYCGNLFFKSFHVYFKHEILRLPRGQLRSIRSIVAQQHVIMKHAPMVQLNE